uniref:ribonuclease Z n=1 Tax=Strongyloides venezuelensis TaxID=75913 RepID=A0A0K0FNB1_STRVS
MLRYTPLIYYFCNNLSSKTSLKIIIRNNTTNFRYLGSFKYTITKQNNNNPKRKEFIPNENKSPINNKDNFYKNTFQKSNYGKVKPNGGRIKINLDQKRNFLREKLENLENTRGKGETIIESMEPPPGKISLEILGNGSYTLSSSVIVRTERNLYLINVPEGLLRSTQHSRIRHSIIRDVFVTRVNINNIGGLPGFFITKEPMDIPDSKTRFHCVPNVLNFSNALRPISDENFGKTKASKSFVEITPEKDRFRDEAFDIKYLPITNSNKSSGVSYCFLFEGTLPQRKVDVNKLLESNIPSGPWLTKLKKEETVTLEDGRIIKPDDILFKLDLTNDKTNLLILDIESIDEIDCLRNSPHLLPYKNNKKNLHYIVHMVRENVYKSDEYKSFMDEIYCNNAKNIIINESASFYPTNSGIYHITKYNNLICPEIYPLLHHCDGLNSFTCDDDTTREGNYLTVKPYARFPMRGIPNSDDKMEISIDISSSNFIVPPNEKEKFEELLAEFKIEYENDPLLKNGDIYPEVTILGTSSAVPSKYRNVSSYLLKTSEKSLFLIDVGESTHSQLFSLYGPYQIDEILVNIKACFMTHSHQDHINGLCNLIFKREEAFKRKNIPYVPLVVTGPWNVKKYIVSYHTFFIKMFHLIEFFTTGHKSEEVDISKLDTLTVNMEERISSHLYNAKDWNLVSIKAVPVKHVGFCNGYVFTDTNGRRFVFSGDTMPCETLIKEGRDADVLIHEATFEDYHKDEASRKRHSTMEQAVTVGEKMCAKYTLLTHFSARYHKVPCLPLYLDEKNVGVAFDFMTIKFNHWHIVPRLNKVLRVAYANELFDIDFKIQQRVLAASIEQIKRKMEKEDAIPSKKVC